MFHRILVGVDDSPAARRALARAIALAADGHGRLGLLASAPRPPSLIATSPIVPPASRSQLEEEMVEWAQRCVEEATELVPADIPVTKIVARGEPVAALRRELETGCWDVAVVGESARRFRLRGSVGTRLGKQETPVLVVHERPAESREAPRTVGRRRWRRAARPAPAEAPKPV